MIQLATHFAADERSRHSDWLRQRKWFIKARNDQIRREELVDDAEDSMLVGATVVTIATNAQIEAFEAKLNIYHDATTMALQENQIEFEQLQKRLMEIDTRLEDIWPHANFMDDGRRVFLNGDRSQAYDEFGTEISNEEYSYDQFPQGHVPVDEFLPDLIARGEIHNAIKANREGRAEIHKFEDLQNQHRDELAKGGITDERLNDMDAELLDEMPVAVRRHVSGFDTADNAPAAKTAFTANAKPLGMEQAVTPSTAPELGLNGG